MNLVVSKPSFPEKFCFLSFLLVMVDWEWVENTYEFETK